MASDEKFAALLDVPQANAVDVRRGRHKAPWDAAPSLAVFHPAFEIE